MPVFSFTLLSDLMAYRPYTGLNAGLAFNSSQPLRCWEYSQNSTWPVTSRHDTTRLFLCQNSWTRWRVVTWRDVTGQVEFGFVVLSKSLTYFAPLSLSSIHVIWYWWKGGDFFEAEKVTWGLVYNDHALRALWYFHHRDEQWLKWKKLYRQVVELWIRGWAPVCGCGPGYCSYDPHCESFFVVA